MTILDFCFIFYYKVIFQFHSVFDYDQCFPLYYYCNLFIITAVEFQSFVIALIQLKTNLE